MTLPGALIVLAILLLITGPVLGLVFFSSDRARSVRYTESTEKAVAASLSQVVIYHPEIVRRYRLDRHHSYVWIHAGLWFYAWGVLLSPGPSSSLAALSWGTQQALGLCLLVGSTLALAGTALGARIGRRRIARRISDNVMSPMLGDDIRLPYMLACAGMPAIFVSMTFYVQTLITNTEPSILGVLFSAVSAAIAGMCLTLGATLISRIRSYTRARDKLLAEALTRMGRNQ